MTIIDWLTLGIAAILVGLMMYGRVAVWKRYATQNATKTPGDVH